MTSTMTRFGIWRRGEGDAFAAGRFARSIMRQARDELAGVRAMIERVERMDFISPKARDSYQFFLTGAVYDFRDTRTAGLTMIERWRGRPGFKEGYRNG